MSREFGTRTVYVIGVGDNPVKVGIADTVKARLSELQVGCPDELIVHHAAHVPYSLACEIERTVHQEFAEHHRRGEWFNVDKAKAIEAVERLKASMLAELRMGLRSEGADLITQLRASYGLRLTAHEAVFHYLGCVQTNAEYVAHANGYMLKKAGMAAYAAFSLLVAQRRPLYLVPEHDRAKAEAALVKAINHLCVFHASVEADRRKRETIKRMVAARDPKPNLRPPSLPPLRAA